MQKQQICHSWYLHSDLLETKDELKGLGTLKQEVLSPNVYTEKEKYNPPVSLDHSPLCQTWIQVREEKKTNKKKK